MVSQSDRIIKASLDAGTSVRRFSAGEVEELLNDRHGEEAPSRRTIRNRLEGLAEVGVLRRWKTYQQGNFKLYSFDDAYRVGLE